MYELFIANKNYSSWSLRPWLLMTELGIAFAERLQPFERGSSWEAFRSFSPTGKVPCLHADGLRLWDSLAIVEFLAERHTGVWPADAQARAWARCAAAEMHAGFGVLREMCSMNCGVRIQPNGIPPDLQRELDRLAELWLEGLARFGGPFLAGERFTAVDAFYAPVAFRVQTYGLRLPDLAEAYVARLLALPAMQAWYAAALAEPWREPAHEAAATQYGQVTSDLRVWPAD
ncbi:MAG: glutathione S-transferase family protein [Aquabacterium sp.]